MFEKEFQLCRLTQPTNTQRQNTAGNMESVLVGTYSYSITFSFTVFFGRPQNDCVRGFIRFSVIAKSLESPGRMSAGQHCRTSEQILSNDDG